METINRNNKTNRSLTIGIFFMILGSLFLMRNIGLDIPLWIISWHTILLAAGAWIGYRKNFKPGGWIVMMIVGAAFTLKDLMFFDFSPYTSAFILIGVGLYLILKPKREMQFCDEFKRRKEHISMDDFNGGR